MFLFCFIFHLSVPLFSLTVCFSKNRLSSAMNPVYSPVQPGTPYGNPKNMAFAGTDAPSTQMRKSIHFLFPVKHLQMIGVIILRMKSSNRGGVFWQICAYHSIKQLSRGMQWEAWLAWWLIESVKPFNYSDELTLSTTEWQIYFYIH